MKNIWRHIAHLILDHRAAWLVVLAAGLAFMGWQASRVKLSYELVKILPKSDPNFQLYENFKKRFGEDGRVLVVGVETPNMYQLPFFQQWYDLTQDLKNTKGLNSVLSNATVYTVVRNDSARKFDFVPLLPQRPTSQAQVDTFAAQLGRLPFYRGFLYNDSSKTYLLTLTLDPQSLNDHNRIDIVDRVKARTEAFTKATGQELFISGMPYIRTEFMGTVLREMITTLVLAVGITALIMFLFFRRFNAVFFPLLVVLVGVVFGMGMVNLFGYQISILLGMVPPLLIVIGIPNCIFLLNRYYEEYQKHGDQRQALLTAVEKVGETIFLANLSTASGFWVFVLTGSLMLVEFGWIASLGVLVTFLLCLVYTPILFSYLAPPAARHVQHLEGGPMARIVTWVEGLVQHRRGWIYGLLAGLVAVSVVGMLRIQAVGYVVDDLPKNSKLMTDLRLLESRFKGIVPFEVAIDTKKPGGVFDPVVLNKIRRLEKDFAAYPEFTEPLSVVRALKFLYQGYRGGDPRFFVLPPITELQKMQAYQGNLGGGASKQFAGFLDSTYRYTRVSFQMQDAGTRRTQQLLAELQPRLDTLFNQSTATGRPINPDEPAYEARITGNGAIFTLGNSYLQQNLLESTLIALGLITLIRLLLFRNLLMVLIATLPSLIPLVITAGLMGFSGINLKPTTILIYSVALGIASDGPLYFLTRYRDEQRQHGYGIRQATLETLRGAGVSMVFTAIILFCGFFIFATSSFGGTRSMGILVSITLLVAMICSLVLLPAMLLSLAAARRETPGGPA